jgi:hypothetical protein
MLAPDIEKAANCSHVYMPLWVLLHPLSTLSPSLDNLLMSR